MISPSGVRGTPGSPRDSRPRCRSGGASSSSVRLRRRIIPTAAASTATIISRTIGLSRRLPDESPPPPPESPTGTTGARSFDFLSFRSPLLCLRSLDLSLGLPDSLLWSLGGVGVVVVVISPEELDESDAPDEWALLEGGASEWAPLEGTFGRYSLPAGPARAVEVSTRDANPASASNLTVPLKVNRSR